MRVFGFSDEEENTYLDDIIEYQKPQFEALKMSPEDAAKLQEVADSEGWEVAPK